MQENGEKRLRIRDSFDDSTAGSPSISTAPPEICSSSVLDSPFSNDEQAAWEDNETVRKDNADDDDDDDIIIIESISSPRPSTGTFDITKVKLESTGSKEDTVVPIETTASASPPPLPQLSSRDVSIGTQTQQNPAVKEEEGDSEDRIKRMWSSDGENNSNHVGSEKDLPPVERNTTKELKSVSADIRTQQNSTINSEKDLREHRNASDKLYPGGQTSAKLENSVLDIVEAQQQQDTLLTLLEVAAKERDESRTQLLHVRSQVDELTSQLLELTQSTVKKEQSHSSTQTNPDEAQECKVLYLHSKEEMKQPQDALSEMKMEKANERERRSQEAAFEYDDELACQIDSLLRQLDQSNKEREELKDEVSKLNPISVVV